MGDLSERMSRPMWPFSTWWFKHVAAGSFVAIDFTFGGSGGIPAIVVLYILWGLERLVKHG